MAGQDRACRLAIFRKIAPPGEAPHPAGAPEGSMGGQSQGLPRPRTELGLGDCSPVCHWLCTLWAYGVTRGVFAGRGGRARPCVGRGESGLMASGLADLWPGGPSMSVPWSAQPSCCPASYQRECGLEVPKVGVAFQGPELWSPGPCSRSSNLGHRQAPPARPYCWGGAPEGHCHRAFWFLPRHWALWPPSVVLHRGPGKPCHGGVTGLNPCLVQIPPK